MSTARGQATAEARLYALRELMLMEMPDRWSDVALRQVTGATTIGDPLYLDAPAIQYNSDAHGTAPSWPTFICGDIKRVWPHEYDHRSERTRRLTSKRINRPSACT